MQPQTQAQASLPPPQQQVVEPRRAAPSAPPPPPPPQPRTLGAHLDALRRGGVVARSASALLGPARPWQTRRGGMRPCCVYDQASFSIGVLY
eukprot:scaffold876_cov68-Phaeocystis_antarctica.AAC.6